MIRRVEAGGAPRGLIPAWDIRGGTKWRRRMYDLGFLKEESEVAGQERYSRWKEQHM